MHVTEGSFAFAVILELRRIRREVMPEIVATAGRELFVQ
jgi:hypothetical protein